MASFTIPKSTALAQNLPVGTFYSVTINPDGSQTWNDAAPADLPAPPTENGSYVLTITGGVATWESAD